jgi:hypothetical protein
MKLSAQLTVLVSVVFALGCFGIAINGLLSLGEITDPAQMGDARGYIGFWTFLGAIASALGGAAWWIIRSGIDEEGF